LSLLLAATCSGSVPLPPRLAQIDVRGRDVAEHKSSKNASNALVSTSIRSAAIDTVAGRGVAPTGPSVTARRSETSAPPWKAASFMCTARGARIAEYPFNRHRCKTTRAGMRSPRQTSFRAGTRRGPGHRSAVAPHFMVRDLDALIVVSSPWVDGASAAGQTLEWLANHGMAELIHRTVVVLNDSDGHADRRTRTILAQHFADHGRVVIEVPFDPHLRPGGVIGVTNEMSPKTRRRFYEIAAAIAEHFSSTAPGPREQRFR
jgi:hypothetical protein